MESKKVPNNMERWVQLCILSLVAVVPGKAVLDLTGNELVNGTWRAPATLPCVYEPSSDFKQLMVTWKFSRPGEAPRTILHHEASGDHLFLIAFRGRVNVATKPPGDVSLHIKELEMTDIGSFVCLVEFESQNMSTISREKTVQLKVVKVPASKPVIEASSQDSVLLSGTRISLTCSANGSPPINYRWYKDGPGGEAEKLRSGPVLAFESLQRSDSARYFCTAENRLNEQREQSDSFQLTVKESSEVSTAGPAVDSEGHMTETGILLHFSAETGTAVWNFVAGTSRRPEMTHTRTESSEVSTAGPAVDSEGHTTETGILLHFSAETGTAVWNFVAGTSRRPEMTHTRTDGMVTSSTAFGNFSGQQKKNAQKKALPLYVIILIAVLSAAFILMIISVVFCRRRSKSDNIYEVTYNNNALVLEGNEDIPASPGVNGSCLYEEPNSSFGNNYTMEPTKAPEYVAMGEKMDNEYEILVTEKKLGN